MARMDCTYANVLLRLRPSLNAIGKAIIVSRYLLEAAAYTLSLSLVIEVNKATAWDCQYLSDFPKMLIRQKSVFRGSHHQPTQQSLD